jgi:methionyl-tRNA formyltransferase
MKVVFLGNHTVGLTSLSTIAETDEILGVVAHPLDPEYGVRYESVYDFALSKGWNVI